MFRLLFAASCYTFYWYSNRSM